MRYFIFSIPFICFLLVSCQVDEQSCTCVEGDNLQELAMQAEHPEEALRLFLSSAMEYANSAYRENVDCQRSWVFSQRRAASKLNYLLQNGAILSGSADSLLEAAIRQAWWVPNHETGKLHMSLGYFYYQSGDYFRARESYEQAVELHKANKEEVTNKPGQNLYKPLGNIYTRLGENEEAIFLLEKSIDLLTEKKNIAEAAYAYSDLSISYWNQGQDSMAITRLSEGISLLDAYQDLQGWQDVKGLLLVNKARLLLDIGQKEEAHNLAKEALELTNAHYILPGAYGILADIQAVLGEYGDALDTYGKAEGLLRQVFGEDRREFAKIELARAKVYQHLKDYDQGLEWCHRALSRVVNGVDTANIYQNPEAVDFYPEITILEALELKGQLFMDVYREQGQPVQLESARDALDKAIGMEEYLRGVYRYQSSLFQLVRESHVRHEQMLNILKAQEAYLPAEVLASAAFKYIEKSRMVVLNNSLNQRAIFQQRLSDATLDSLKYIQAQINLKEAALFEYKLENPADADGIGQIQKQLGALKREYGQMTEQQLSGMPTYQQLLRETSTVAVESVQEYLAQEEAVLVEYFLGTEYLYGIVLDGRTIKFKRLGLSQTIREKLSLLVAKLSDWGYIDNQLGGNKQAFHFFTANSRAIYQQVLQPFFGNKPPDKLIVVPDGELGYLPFDILLTENISVDSINYQDLPYLLRESTVWQVHSALDMIRSVTPSNTPSGDYLGVAPDYTNCSLRPSRHGAEAVKTVNQQFHGKLLMGEEASVDNFILHAPNYKVIHFHGHAKGLNQDPGFSWLAFTDLEEVESPIEEGQSSPSFAALLHSTTALPPEFDRLYFANRINNMDLSAKLVVLAGCETGKGKIAPGEGIISLARAFRYANCPNIMMTLWEVKDFATKEVTIAFFNHLHSGAIGKAEALRAAKLDYLAKSDPGYDAYPGFWAPYVLVGDNRPLK